MKIKKKNQKIMKKSVDNTEERRKKDEEIKKDYGRVGRDILNIINKSKENKGDKDRDER